MSVYGLHKLCRKISKDPAFRARMQQAPAEALADPDLPLSDAERALVLRGDVRRLHDLGVHGFLLSQLGRQGIAGLTPELYVARLKDGAPVPDSV